VAVRLVVLGPPGAGKGTQAERFARVRAVPRISTGDILREAVLAGTELGRATKAVMESGQLVGDDLMIGIVQERLGRADARRGFVLDGFPRTVAQAVALDRLLDNSAPLVIVNMEVPEDRLIERLSWRRICGSCGWNAGQRLRVHERDTEPLVEFYRVRPTFRSIDGDQTPDAVTADLAAAVASVIGGQA
jgi:adenylate kinase